MRYDRSPYYQTAFPSHSVALFLHVQELAASRTSSNFSHFFFIFLFYNLPSPLHMLQYFLRALHLSVDN